MSTTQRRELAFDNLDEVMAEIDRLAAGNPTTTGKHSFPEIVRHLALTNDMTSGRMTAPRPPLFLRLLLPLIRSSILRGPVKPGIRLNAAAEAVFWPANEISLADAISMFRDSVAYYNQHGPLPVHPMFGKATRQQIDRLTCSHAAMHLSFVHPGSQSP